jgi:HD-GYP domain-containing protein (c-di-GMP phosphodiesterase class II)
MPSSLIEVSGGAPHCLKWRSNYRLRVGRTPTLEIVLDDVPCSRQHAEIVATDYGWVVRDLGSSNGTFLNSARVGRTGQRLRIGDVIHIGSTPLHVDSIIDDPAAPDWSPSNTVRVESTAIGFWNEAIDGRSAQNSELDGRLRAFIKLLREVFRISHSKTFEPGLQSLLNDVVGVFRAQRCGVFLPDPITGQLAVKCMAVPKRALSPRDTLSKTLAQRTFDAGRSMLFRDDEATRAAESVKRGAMSSIICAVLLFPDAPCGVLHLDRGPLQEPFTESDLYLADSLAAALALGIERWQLVEQQQDALLQTVTALAQAVEMRDPYTGNHTHRVTTYALLLSDEMGLPPADRRLLQVATPLHDIGKIAVDDSVLRKTGSLSTAEFAIMKGHVANGVNIIQMVPSLAWTLPVIRSHHERWDGSGYPDGLKGTDIPLPARIVAVADAFDAMTSDRPYRKGLTLDQAFRELQAKSGAHFDPSCVNAFLRVRSKVESLLGQEAKLQTEAADITKTMSDHESHRLLLQTLGPGDALPQFS